MKTNDENILSNCCDSPVLIAGRTTKYYECSKCKHACDTHWTDETNIYNF
jgi:hypothetical protein